MGEPIHGTPIPPSTDRGYEHSDVAIRPLAIFIAGLAITLIIVTGLMAALFWIFESGAEKRDPAPLPLAEESPSTPGPLLQVSPREDLDQMRQREHQVLSTPAWVDRDRGVARIPIDRAMALAAERGLPNWPVVEEPQPQADGATEADRAPRTPEARTDEGTGQSTPVEGGREP
jgi:hypothetical protein